MKLLTEYSLHKIFFFRSKPCILKLEMVKCFQFQEFQAKKKKYLQFQGEGGPTKDPKWDLSSLVAS